MIIHQAGSPIGADTLPSLLVQRAGRTPSSPAQWALESGGGWRSSTWAEYFEATSCMASALRGLGLRPGDRLGIMAPSCVEWDVIQMAALAAGATVVGIDVHEHDVRLAAILELAEITALVVGDEDLLSRLPLMARDRLSFVVSFAPSSGASAVLHWNDLVHSAAGAEWLDQAAPEMPALIVFTSGTTGSPKGIVYTHRQVCLACASILEAFSDIGPGSRLACWLPLSNLFQRMINFCAIAQGGETYYVDNPRDIMRHVARIAPHVFIAVPRFYEKLYNGIIERIHSGPGWLQRVFELARRNAKILAGARRREQACSSFRRMTHLMLDALVLRRIRAVLGGEIRFLVSGSAPMPVWLLEEFDALGMPVYEAYGMSENIVPISANRPGASKLGSVGRPLRNNEVCIAEDGELLVRGPGVFSGYLGEPPAARTADGYFASGDYAERDAEGFIRLTGRKSDIFKTSTGRRIAPAGIEARITQLPCVEQAAIIGANRPCLVAIVWVASTCIDAGVVKKDTAQIQMEVRKAVADLPDYQQPAGLVLTARMPSVERGEITANLKLRRRQVETNYASEIEQVYSQLQDSKGIGVVVVAE